MRTRPATVILTVVIVVMSVIGLSSVPAMAASGDLDSAFGVGGLVTGAAGRDLAIRPDGAIVTVGPYPSNHSFVERYLSDGSPDGSFGADGRVASDIDLWSVVLQPDGGIVVAGGLDGDVALARYLTDGTPDPSFSGNGRVKTDLGLPYDVARGLTLTPSGQIVVAAEGYSTRPFLLQYLTSGELNPDFSRDGIARSPARGSGFFKEALILPNGKIVAVGGIDGKYLLTRYLADGSRDRTFGDHGAITARQGNFLGLEGSVLQPDGRMVVVSRCFKHHRHRMCLARFRPNGKFDDTFGGGDGKVMTSFGGPFPVDQGYGVALQADGKIVAVGDRSSKEYAVVRYGADGSLDPDFGSGGIVLTDTDASENESARAVAIQESGALVVAGFTTLARYLA